MLCTQSYTTGKFSRVWAKRFVTSSLGGVRNRKKMKPKTKTEGGARERCTRATQKTPTLVEPSVFLHSSLAHSSVIGFRSKGFRARDPSSCQLECLARNCSHRCLARNCSHRHPEGFAKACLICTRLKLEPFTKSLSLHI